MTRGKYIVIEGSDGTGKTTQATLLQQQLQAAGVDAVLLHEPGGTPLGEALRTIIINKDIPRTPESNLLLFTAARHELAAAIEQHLAAGQWVIASRSWLSTLAYQGYGEGLNVEQITAITKTYTSPHYLAPDCALILTISTEARTARMTERGGGHEQDAFETKQATFQRQLDQGYREIAATHQLPLIDTTPPPEQVAEVIWQHVAPLLAAR